MTIAQLAENLGLQLFSESFPSEFPVEELGGLEATSHSIVEGFQTNTVTVKQINSFIKKGLELLPVPVILYVHAYLLTKNARLLFSEGHEEESLAACDAALRVNELASTWALKGNTLLQMERLDEAFEAFGKAHSLKENFGPQKRDHLVNLFGSWSIAALLRGLSGILEEDLTEAQKGVNEYLSVRGKATSEGLEGALGELAAHESSSPQLQSAIEELNLMVRLLTIKNPFDRWRELTKEISKVWPEGVSAVDSIREHRK